MPRVQLSSFSPIAVLACLLIMLIASPLFAQPEPTETELDPGRIELPEFDSLRSGTVTHVLDQNTLLIEIDGRSIRCDLLGVGAGSPNPKDARSKAAIESIKRLVLGEGVLIQDDPSGKLSTSKRRVAYLFRSPDHLFINLEIVRQGLTRHSDASMTIHRTAFSHYESRAKQLERGIWDPEFDQNLSPADDDIREPPEPAQDAKKQGTVYITTYGTRYHLKDCPHLTDSARPTTRERVGDTHKPCKTCEPGT